MLFKKSLRKLLYVLIPGLACFSAGAQFSIRNPSYKTKESSELTIDAIRFYPDSLILDLQYYGSPRFDNPGFYINNTTKIEFVNGGDWPFATWSSRVSNLVNAYYSNMTYVRKSTYHSFSVVFPFSLFKIVEGQNGDKRKAFDFFLMSDPLQINFINCDKNYRSQHQLNYGNCFDIEQLKLTLPLESWTALWCSSFMNQYLVKDEFETTAKYKARLSPDSVRAKIEDQAQQIHDYFAINYLSRIKKQVPAINYDSDNEIFSIEYQGAQKMTVSMPISTAPAFKKKMVEGNLSLNDMSLVQLSSGTYFIESIDYKDKSTGKIITIDNKLDEPGDAISALQIKTLNWLRSNYKGYNGF